MLRTRFIAIGAAALIAGGFSASAASAGGLGGDCCADLEERVAELEATTVRKGNRKVSITLSGFIAKQLLYWDDGFQSDTYITDTGSVSIGSHFALTGEARINSSTTAGYTFKFESMSVDSLLVSQSSDDGLAGGGPALNQLTGKAASTIAVESSFVYVKNESLGRFSLGLQSSAVDNQAIIVDGSGSLIQANYVLYDTNAFFLRRTDGGLAGVLWGHIANCQALNGDGGVNADCDGVPNHNVRYDSPSFGGLSFSASWGEDDVLGVSGRFSKKLGDIQLNTAIAYGHSTDENGNGSIFSQNAGATANGGLDVAHLQIGGYAEHVPSGLFLYGAYGTEFLETTASVRGAGQTNPEGSNWYLKAGLKGKWAAIGGTTLYANYGQNDDRFTTGMYDAGVNATQLTQYGAGIVQGIDSIGMSIWLSYKHYESDVTCNDADAVVAGNCGSLNLDNGVTSFEDMDIVKFGALIPF